MKKEMILQTLDFKAFYQQHCPDLKPQSNGQGMARCPFHPDETASLSVNLSNGLFNCFGCKAKGDVFDFYQKLKGVDFKTALAEMGGAALEPPKTIEAEFDYRKGKSSFRWSGITRRHLGHGGQMETEAGLTTSKVRC